MILVTGGTGLVGAHLLYHLLLENKSVRAIYRKNSDLNAVKAVFGYYTGEVEEYFNKIVWIPADLGEPATLAMAFEGVSQVYHCAALVSFDPKDAAAMYRINTEGTAHVVNLCIDTGVQKLCFVSSIATIGTAVGAVADETNEWNPEADHHAYAQTKYQAEMEVWRASQEGVSVVIVHPGVILGGGFWKKGSGAIFDRGSRGLPWYTEGITGYVSVEDVVKAMICLTNSTQTNEGYILVSENRSCREILSAIASAFEKKVPFINLPPWITEFLWRVGFVRSLFSKKSPLLTKHAARSLHHKQAYSSEKIHRALAFSFEPIDQVIKKVCAQYARS